MHICKIKKKIVEITINKDYHYYYYYYYYYYYLWETLRKSKKRDTVL